MKRAEESGMTMLTLGSLGCANLLDFGRHVARAEGADESWDGC
jgi:hypothetical protein